MNAVDTNVYVYAFDKSDLIKHAKATELLALLAVHPADTVLVWQVAAEFLGVLRRWQDAGQLTPQAVDEAFRIAMGMHRMRRPTSRIFKTSATIRSRFPVSHWDSMLLAACKLAKVDILYSEDMSHGVSYDGVTVINPFA